MDTATDLTGQEQNVAVVDAPPAANAIPSDIASALADLPPDELEPVSPQNEPAPSATQPPAPPAEPQQAVQPPPVQPVTQGEPATDAPPEPQQAQQATEESEPGETPPVDDMQALLSHIKGETPPESAETKPETADPEPWHTRLSDEELADVKGQIKVNDDGTVSVPQVVVNKAGQKETHVKQYASVQEALGSLVDAPLTTRRAIYDAQHAQEQLEALRTNAATAQPPVSPGEVKPDSNTPVIADLKAFGQQGTQNETQPTQDVNTQAAASVVPMQSQAYEMARQEELRALEPLAYNKVRQELEEEKREEKGLEPDDPIRWTAVDERKAKTAAKDWLNDEAGQMLNEWQMYFQREQAQASLALGQEADKILAPMSAYHNRVRIAGQAPQGEDEVALHNALTGMDGGSPNLTVLGSVFLNHKALVKSLPEMIAQARKEGEAAVIERVEQWRMQRNTAPASPQSAQLSSQQGTESRTGAVTTPPGFSNAAAPQGGILDELDQSEPERPDWM
jgi:hypothetical protein